MNWQPLGEMDGRKVYILRKERKIGGYKHLIGHSFDNIFYPWMYRSVSKMPIDELEGYQMAIFEPENFKWQKVSETDFSKLQFMEVVVRKHSRFSAPEEQNDWRRSYHFDICSIDGDGPLSKFCYEGFGDDLVEWAEII